MPIIEFGPWMPDQPSLANKCITATNVYPVEMGYAPFPAASALSEALPAQAVGVISFRRTNGDRETFAGTETRLYRLDGLSWTDVSPSAYTTSAFWRFAVYGDRLIATNGVDNPQAFDLGTDTVFADLPNAPIHRYPIVIRDTLVALDVQDGSGFDIKWSANNDSEDWTAASGGGSQNLADGGPVMGGTGGEFGVVLQEQGLVRMDFVGGDLRFTFDKIEGSVGCIARGSIVQNKGYTFYLSEAGFQVFDGAVSTNISQEVCSKTFFSSLTREDNMISDGLEIITDENDDPIAGGALTEIDGALDVANACVVWKYPAEAGGNRLFIYNYALGRWSESDENVETLFTYIEGGGSFLAGFTSDFKIAPFTGSDATAVVATGDIQVNRMGASFVRSVRGLVDAAHDITVGKKTDLADTSTTASGSSNSNGKVSLRAHGRFHSFSLSPTAAFTDLVGVDVEVAPQGGRA